MSDALVLAIDNGTSSTKCLVVDDGGRVVGRGQAPVALATPEPGWVEQDANEIWASVRRAVADALDPATAKRARSLRPMKAQRKADLALRLLKSLFATLPFRCGSSV